MHSFEVFIRGDRVEAKDWYELVRWLSSQVETFEIEVKFGSGNSLEVVVRMEGVIRAGALGPFVFRPAVREEKGEDTRLRVRYRLPMNKNWLEAQKQEEWARRRTITGVRLGFRKVWRVVICQMKVYLRDSRGEERMSSYYTLGNPLLDLEIDFGGDRQMEKKQLPVVMELGEAGEILKVRGEGGGKILEAGRKYLKLDSFDFTKHALVVGQIGVGKSKLLEILVGRLRRECKDEYGIVVIDPHAAMRFREEEAPEVLDFVRGGCELFEGGADPHMATEMTTLVFKAMLGSQYGAKLERVLKFAVFTLLTAKKMSVASLRRFLGEIEFRNEVLGEMGENNQLKHFWETEFAEIETKYYEIAVAGILAVVDELSLTTAFSGVGAVSLSGLIQEKGLVYVSLNRTILGDRATRTIAGLIIAQVFMLAMTGGVGKKLILMVDEVSLIENEGLATVLAEARKFGLTVYVSQQYLSQVSDGLLASILANVYNYFVFRVSDEDARVLGRNMNLVFPEWVIEEAKKKGITEEELKRQVLVKLDPRMCVARLFANGKYYPAFEGRTVDYEQSG